MTEVRGDKLAAVAALVSSLPQPHGQNDFKRQIVPDIIVHPTDAAKAECAASSQDFSTQDAISFDLGLPSDVPRIDSFVPREAEMKAMKDHLLSDTIPRSQRRVALHGLGGMGKTQLALGFARAYRDRFSSVFFLNGASPATILESISSALDRIWQIWPAGTAGRPNQKPLTPDSIAETALKWFSIRENDRWLIIYDNVDREASRDFNLDKYLPRTDHGAIIITTRLTSLYGSAKSVEVSKMDEKQAGQLLDNNLDIALPTYDSVAKMTDYTEMAHKAKTRLLNTLDGLPLALVQAGRYITETHMTIDKFLQLYNSSKADLLESLPSGKQRDGDPTGSILTTWKVSLDQLEQCSSDDPGKRRLYGNAAKLMLLFGFFDPREIWYEFLQGGLLDPEAPEWFREVVGSELSFFNTMRVLLRYSLVNPTGKDGCFRMHSLLHDYCQNFVPQQESLPLLHLAISIVGYSVPPWIHTDRWKLERRVLPHANVILDYLHPELRVDVGGFDVRTLEESRRKLAYKLLAPPGIEGVTLTLTHPVERLATLFQHHERPEVAM
jgi:hypothetical protein